MTNIIEQARDEIAGWTIGSGYYQTTIGVGEAGEIAETLHARGLLSPRTITPEQREAAISTYHTSAFGCDCDGCRDTAAEHVDGVLVALGLAVSR